MTMVTTKAMDVDEDDHEGDDASSTMCGKGDNHNCNDGKDACALTATMPEHRRCRRHSQL